MKAKTNRGRSGKKNRVKIRVPIRYVWASPYGYHSPADPYRAATDGRKGGGNPRATGDRDKPAFTLGVDGRFEAKVIT